MAKKVTKRERGSTPERGGRPVELDHNAFMLICEELTRTGSKYKSCEALGFNYTTVIEAIKKKEDAGDDSWRELWTESYDKFRDSLEQEAFRRGRDGTPTKWAMNPKTGELRPVEITFSDRLLELSLKGHFPERYREKVHVAGQIGLEPIDAFANLTPKAKRAIRAIIIQDLEEQRELAAAREGDFIEATATEQLEDMRETHEDD